MFSILATPPSSSHRSVAADLYFGKSAVQLCNNAFISVDRNWRVTYWNKGAERMLDTLSSDILGKNIWEKLFSIIPVEFYGFYEKIFVPGASYQFNYYWAEVNAWIEVCTFSETDGFSISLQTQFIPGGEDAFNQSRYLYPIYRFITESKQECLWNWKIDSGERFWIDGGLQKLFGYNIENTFLPNAFWENRIHPDDLERVRTSIELFVQSNDHDWLLQYRFRKADGKYIDIYETGLKFYNQDNKADEVIGAMYEISEKLPVDSKNSRSRTPRQKEIAAAILTAQETERHEIGYKLNDDLNQILAIAKVYIQLSSTSPVSQDVYLKKAMSLIDQVISGIRNITEEILLPNSKLIGLFQHMENICNHSQTRHKIRIRFTYAGFDEDELDEECKFAILRITQEQIRVIASAKGVKKVNVDLQRKKNKINLKISDDRQLADLAKERGKDSYTNIQSRAGIFNGTSSMYETSGNTCTLKVSFPVSVPVNAREPDYSS